jgi:fermentation-respiration switch protein FrsA (DUF1100 family)
MQLAVDVRTRDAHAGEPNGLGAGFRWVRRLVAALLTLAGVFAIGYAGLAAYAATQLIYVPPSPITRTPSSLGLPYHDVTFPARGDGLTLRGWFIPGVLPDGSFTDAWTIIMVHGTRTNRTDLPAGLLNLSGELARHGFAILAFDMRGMGESAPAPITFGLDEQRDVLGAVDFLRSGEMPYPELGRPRAIGGWGVSMGGATLLFAAAQEPAIRAVVADSAYADFMPIIEEQLPKASGLPPLTTPGVLAAASALYGANYFDIRPVDVVARIAPRPAFFIQGMADHEVPPGDARTLYDAARAAVRSRASIWQVPGADHAQSYHVAGQAYVNRVVAFYAATLRA